MIQSKTMKWKAAGLSLLLAVLFFSACGGGSGTADQPAKPETPVGDSVAAQVPAAGKAAPTSTPEVPETASALSATFSDPIGDVMYDSGTFPPVTHRVDNMPHIDITQISYEATEDTVTLSMRVHGEIMFSENAFYTMKLFSAGPGIYFDGTYEFNWSNGDHGSSFSCKGVMDSEERVTIPPISVVAEGNTLTVTFQRVCDFKAPITFTGHTLYRERNSDESWSDDVM